MKLETVTFDRVFDVVRRQWKTDRWTEFSFVCAGRTVYGARVQGHPPLQGGMTVTVVQQRAGDWATLLGWKDQHTGALHVEDRARGLWGISTIVIAYYLLFTPLLIPGLLTGAGVGRASAVVALGVPAMLLAMNIRRRMQCNSARRLLLEAP